MSFALKASSRVSTASVRSSRSGLCAPIRTVSGARVRSVVVRAEAEKTAESDISAQATEALTKATEFVKTVWEDTADAEKPAAIAIILASIVVQIAIGATVDSVDRLPFLGDLFELIGVAVVATYTYKYVTDPAERASAKATIDSLVSAVTGQKSKST